MAGRAPDTLHRSESWTDLALCRGYEDEYFSDAKTVIRWAKQRCGRCPVRRQCLTDALGWESIRGNVAHGVRGGLSASERRAFLGQPAEKQVQE
jgi:WhiB family redox-sensing transcriptional regulator